MVTQTTMAYLVGFNANKRQADKEIASDPQSENAKGSNAEKYVVVLQEPLCQRFNTSGFVYV